MPLPEDIRQDYLQALGIDSYFPRIRLPAAPEPVACDWPASWQVPVAPPPGQPQPASGIDAGESASRRDKPPATVRDPAKTPAKTPTKIPAKTEPREPAENPELSPAAGKPSPAPDEIHVQGICMQVNAALAIFNVMPHLGPQQLGARHQALLANLLKGSGIGHEQLRIDEKPFRWPMVQGGHVDNGRSAAATALSAYLQQKQVDWQFRNLLILGETAVKQLFAEEGNDGKSPGLDGQPWRNFYTRSLDECLQRPVLKKEVWQVIRQLAV